MKLITAYIQPHALTNVKQALYNKEIYRMSISNILGCGQQKGLPENYRGTDVEVTLLKKVRIEIAVNDEFVEVCKKAIIEGARSGEIGDGKIFVTNIEQCVRIRTDETGNDAIG